ncbi:MAG TPA: formimidoylglutamate deiminase, partial [Casimicrobiaceae bacterium]|nr:formimidoylglutamate deiminase [Casimicrobiaceae bacterium]
MKTLLAPAVLLDEGWQTDVALTIDDDGVIAKIEPRARGASADERLHGPVIPAMPNLHSHAFQRAIA